MPLHHGQLTVRISSRKDEQLYQCSWQLLNINFHRITKPPIPCKNQTQIDTRQRIEKVKIHQQFFFLQIFKPEKKLHNCLEKKIVTDISPLQRLAIRFSVTSLTKSSFSPGIKKRWKRRKRRGKSSPSELLKRRVLKWIRRSELFLMKFQVLHMKDKFFEDNCLVQKFDYTIQTS